MIVGSVDASVEAIIPLRVRGPSGATIGVQTVLDTGFNDWLPLSRPEIEALALTFREEGRYMLANGTEAASRLFAAEVERLGQWGRVLIVEMEGGSLPGMAMLRGFHLGVDVVEGGRVEVRAVNTEAR